MIQINKKRLIQIGLFGLIIVGLVVIGLVLWNKPELVTAAWWPSFAPQWRGYGG